MGAKTHVSSILKCWWQHCMSITCHGHGLGMCTCFQMGVTWQLHRHVYCMYSCVTYICIHFTLMFLSDQNIWRQLKYNIKYFTIHYIYNLTILCISAKQFLLINTYKIVFNNIIRAFIMSYYIIFKYVIEHSLTFLNRSCFTGPIYNTVDKLNNGNILEYHKVCHTYVVYVYSAYHHIHVGTARGCFTIHWIQSTNRESLPILYYVQVSWFVH